MKYDKEIAALTIRNIATVESSIRVVRDVEETLFKALSGTVKQMIKSSALTISKDGNFDLDTVNDVHLYFSVKEWESKQDVPFAWYTMTYGGINDEWGCEWLTYALGEYSESNSMKFVLEISTQEYKNHFELDPRSLKRRVRDAFQNKADLRHAGFELDNKEGQIYLNFQLDKEHVAAEYPNFDACLRPLQDAVATLIRLHPVMEELVREVTAPE